MHAGKVQGTLNQLTRGWPNRCHSPGQVAAPHQQTHKQAWLFIVSRERCLASLAVFVVRDAFARLTLTDMFGMTTETI